MAKERLSKLQKWILMRCYNHPVEKYSISTEGTIEFDDMMSFAEIIETLLASSQKIEIFLYLPWNR